MSLVVTPPINSTETFQVATPFSYSFTYPTVVQTVDSPVYYFGGNLLIGNNGSNSTIIKCFDYQNPVTGNGLTYTVSNMTPTTDVLECVLPIPREDYTINGTSYVTFGGPDLLYLSSTLPDTSNSIPALYYATFGSYGPFAYGLDNSTTDSLRYIPLAGSPVSAFQIILKRPLISNASVYAEVVNNIMDVRSMYSSSPGQVTLGMIFSFPGVDCTVTAYGTGRGGTGTYTLTRNTGSGAVNASLQVLSSSTVVNSGDVLLSNSMTPSSGTARFDISTRFTYTRPPPEV